MKRMAVIAAGLMITASTALGQTAAPSDAYLYIITPRDGARVRNPVIVRFGLRNMGVTRAGDTAANVGHHHLLVDAKALPDVKEPIPTDKTHLHFGSGQTETKLDLPRGQHTLQLVLGDAEHRIFKPPVISRKIRITVVK
jgi:Domain of unknown function (DUF4399)